MVMGELAQETELLVIGGGPGGYAAAFRAADLGMDVTLVDIDSRPGGACLFRGCIPSKTYLYVAELIHDAGRAETMGVRFGDPEIDLDGLRTWKSKVVEKMASGLVSLCKQRGVQLIQGRAAFESSREVRVVESDASTITFKHCILATGSRPVAFPGTRFRKGGRIMSSTGALEIPEVPERLFVLGGGYVGLELGMVYASLGAKVTLAEMADQILPGVDADLVKPLAKRIESLFADVRLGVRVESMEETDDGVTVKIGDGDPETFDRALVAIGRKANTDGLKLENTGVTLNGDGFVEVDEKQRTSDERIYAVGDLVGGMMLAHKASREGKVAAEVIAGEPAAFDVRAIPAVVYTDPQLAWAGLTENEAKESGRDVEIQRFPWKYSGRAATMGLSEGLTKILVDPESRRVVGVGIVGRDTEGLISEGVLAIEMGAVIEDVALSIHPHPTLSETEAEAAEIFLGGATHAPPEKKKS
jgi:dihydrolipoamide dehydrogenase